MTPDERERTLAAVTRERFAGVIDEPESDEVKARRRRLAVEADADYFARLPPRRHRAR